MYFYPITELSSCIFIICKIYDTNLILAKIMRAKITIVHFHYS